MLTIFDDVLLIVGCPLATLLFLCILNHLWPASQRRDHNDIIGWQISVLGTTYAVIMGFMLYAVWTSYQEADLNASTEANCLVSVFRLADGLPPAQRDKVHRLARQYADIVINEEWPAMHKGELSLAGHNTIQQLWTATLETKPASFSEQTSMNLTLSEISTMTEHRRARELEGQSKLPGVLWMVLIAGGIITMFSSCLFGAESFRLHCVQVVSVALLISLTLVAIADIDRPFRGSVHLHPHAFERARETFAELP